ncbi:MAG: alpha-galactosidase [Acidobacteriia bacterium]|nr:alpha-galactosidase [Terriglobia bacterium]
MSGESISRRDFMRVGAGAAALGAFADGGTTEAAAREVAGSPADSPAPRKLGSDAEMAIAADWARAFAAASADVRKQAKTDLLPDLLQPPFSFIYGGDKSADLLRGWKTDVQPSNSEEMGQQREITYTDPAGGLVVRIAVTVFEDFPAVEWVMHFKNAGSADTPILQDIQALDAPLRCVDGDPVIHYARGATCSMNDFMPVTRTLGPRGWLHLEPGGGRSSSQFLPFFNLEAKDEGVVAAIGWSGEWAATFGHPEGSDLFRSQAGMALTHLRLHPGEEIRTPRILTLFWQGERRRGNNLLRRFILAHHRPAPGGKPLVTPITNHNWGGTPAADHLENIRQIIAHDLPIEYYWIDAEWFGNGPWWKNPGNWQVKKDLYPQGFKPISDLLHSSGRKLLLWFEPERVCEGTPWYTEHSAWLLEAPKDRRVYRGFDGKGDWDVPMSDPRWVPNESSRNQIQENDKLFNLGIPEARRFLTDFISTKVEEFGLDCFRNDANIAPLEFWRAADAPDRQGITEVRWVEGFYAFWDELLRRHPNLIIDDCASGGRRIDLETIGRSTALSRTDFVFNLLANQCHSYGLLEWVPLNTTSAGNLSNHNEYAIRSSMTSGLSFGLFSSGDAPQAKVDLTHFPFAEVKRSIERYRTVQKYFYGDYYALTEYTQANDAWMAYQLDLPEEGEGLVVVLKRPESPYTQAAFRLHALRTDVTYKVTNPDTGEDRTLAGGELLEKGLEARLLNRPDSALYLYRRKP